MLAKDSDDPDLDALMIRVREAALGAAGGGTASALTQAAGATRGDSDLIRVIDAQGEWNEHTRKLLAELAECLRTLRDDWAAAQKGLRDEMNKLSALVRQLQTKPDRAAARPKPSASAPRGRRAIASRR